MRIVISEFISLDGVVQAPGGAQEDTDGGFAHGGWSLPYYDEDVMGATQDEIMRGTDAMLFGRRTWQVSAAAWPGRSGDPFSDRINAIPKYVASRTLTEADMVWDSHLLPADDAIGAIGDLKAEDGGDLQVYGSASLVSQLVEHDLVDEYRLMIEPLLLGGGKRVFPGSAVMRPLRLVSATPTSTGVLVCCYQPVRG